MKTLTIGVCAFVMLAAFGCNESTPEGNAVKDLEAVKAGVALKSGI